MKPPLPPEDYRRLVCGNDWERFEELGEGLAGMLASLGLISAGTRLLDVGCGCGRLARHLLDTPLAGYFGFDRHPGMIAWCSAELSPRRPDFEFHAFELESPYTSLDGEAGRFRVADFAFPVPPARFDTILASSVFTHLSPDDVAAYLGRFAEWLAPSGRALVSLFHDAVASSQEGLGFSLTTDDWDRLVSAAGLRATRLFDLQYGSHHNWYLLADAGSAGAGSR